MKFLRYSLTVLLLIAASTTLQAQSLEDAINLFNKALEDAKANSFDAAISGFTQAITVAEQLGEEGADIKTRSEKQIPGLYYKKAVTAFNGFRSSKQLGDLDGAIAEFNQSVSISDQYGNAELSQKATRIIPQLHYQKSLMLYKTEDLAGADASLDQAISLNPNYAKAHFQKAIVFKKSNAGNVDGFVSLIDKAIEVAGATSDNKTLRSAKESAHDELLYRASQNIEKNRLSDAVAQLNQALVYDADSEDVYYRMAEALNKRGDYNGALSNAQKSLGLENGGKSDKAKIYFEIGVAQQGLGNNSAACDALSNAAFGAFKAPAEHKMEFELKCKTANP